MVKQKKIVLTHFCQEFWQLATLLALEAESVCAIIPRFPMVAKKKDSAVHARRGGGSPGRGGSPDEFQKYPKIVLSSWGKPNFHVNGFDVGKLSLPFSL